MSNTFLKTATITLLLLLAVGFWSVSCSSPASKDAQLNGEIFIVTRGRENIKLGLVTVKIADISGNEIVYAPNFVTEVKTNADGKFSVRLPVGEYRVFAQTQRDVFGKTELYYWRVPVKLTEAGQTVFLSNDNICEECYQR